MNIQMCKIKFGIFSWNFIKINIIVKKSQVKAGT